MSLFRVGVEVMVRIGGGGLPESEPAVLEVEQPRLGVAVRAANEDLVPGVAEAAALDHLLADAGGKRVVRQLARGPVEGAERVDGDVDNPGHGVPLGRGPKPGRSR